MFVVRNIFSKPNLLAATVRKLAAAGEIPAARGAERDPLDFLVHSARSAADHAGMGPDYNLMD